MDSFLQGREHIVVNDVATNQEDSNSNTIEPRETLQPEKGKVMSNARVQTIYEKDVLKKIVIHCDCGKELVLSLEYK